MIIDAGERRYELVEGWGELPEGGQWGQAGAVGVDSQDRVHVFTRARQPYRYVAEVLEGARLQKFTRVRWSAWPWPANLLHRMDR